MWMQQRQDLITRMSLWQLVSHLKNMAKRCNFAVHSILTSSLITRVNEKFWIEYNIRISLSSSFRYKTIQMEWVQRYLTISFLWYRIERFCLISIPKGFSILLDKHLRIETKETNDYKDKERTLIPQQTEEELLVESISNSAELYPVQWCPH